MNYLVIGQLNEYKFFSAFRWSTSDTPPASKCRTVQRPISNLLWGLCIAVIFGIRPEVYQLDVTVNKAAAIWSRASRICDVPNFENVKGEIGLWPLHRFTLVYCDSFGTRDPLMLWFFILCPCDDSQGSLCCPSVCLSVHPSVRPSVHSA